MDSIDIALYLAYALTLLAGLGAVVFPIINSVNDPASLKKGGMGVLGLIIVFGISYALSGAEVTEKYLEKGVDSGLSQFVGGILTMTYLAIFIAIIGIVYTEFSKIIKK